MWTWKFERWCSRRAAIHQLLMTRICHLQFCSYAWHGSNNHVICSYFPAKRFEGSTSHIGRPSNSNQLDFEHMKLYEYRKKQFTATIDVLFYLFFRSCRALEAFFIPHNCSSPSPHSALCFVTHKTMRDLTSPGKNGFSQFIHGKLEMTRIKVRRVGRSAAVCVSWFSFKIIQ